MEGGEISPLDAESSYQKFRKELQAFSLEVNGMDEDEQERGQRAALCDSSVLLKGL